jgi:adenylyltransferase/sulfurtransferase
MESLIREIKAEDLHQLIKEGNRPYMIDIREDYEYEDGHLNGMHIPMEDLVDRRDEIPKDETVVIYCNSGGRSKPMTWVLSTDFGFTNILSLEGGYEAYAQNFL